MSVSIAIAGAAGRMGQALLSAAKARTDLRVTGASERVGCPLLGQEAMAGVALVDDAAHASANADVWIDFTAPAATLAALSSIKSRAAIVGTTGFTAGEEAQISDAAKRLAIVRSGNFSLGVNLLAGLVRQAAQKLGPDWDIEILEAHHRHKKDAPSGTALLLGEAAAEGRGRKLADIKLPPRDGVTGPRPEGGIGFVVARAGGVIGAHEVMFASEREMITLKHDALDRAVFADGALAAALWVAGKPAGLYSMRDVLGL